MVWLLWLLRRIIALAALLVRLLRAIVAPTGTVLWGWHRLVVRLLAAWSIVALHVLLRLRCIRILPSLAVLRRVLRLWRLSVHRLLLVALRGTLL